MTAVDNNRRTVARGEREEVIRRAREELRTTERFLQERERERLAPRLRRAGLIR